MPEEPYFSIGKNLQVWKRNDESASLTQPVLLLLLKLFQKMMRKDQEEIRHSIITLHNRNVRADNPSSPLIGILVDRTNDGMLVEPVKLEDCISTGPSSKDIDSFARFHLSTDVSHCSTSQRHDSSK